MQEYLKLIGVKWHAIWIASLIRSMLIYTAISVLITVLTKIQMEANSKLNGQIQYKSVLAKTDFTIILGLLLVYSMQVSMFNLLVSQFFNSREFYLLNFKKKIIYQEKFSQSKAFNAKIFSLVLWMFSSVNLYDGAPAFVKYFLCMFPNLAVTFGIQVIFQFERSGNYMVKQIIETLLNFNQ